MPCLSKDTMAEKNRIYGDPRGLACVMRHGFRTTWFASFRLGKISTSIAFHKNAAPALKAALDEPYVAGVTSMRWCCHRAPDPDIVGGRVNQTGTSDASDATRSFRARSWIIETVRMSVPTTSL